MISDNENAVMTPSFRMISDDSATVNPSVLQNMVVQIKWKLQEKNFLTENGQTIFGMSRHLKLRFHTQQSSFTASIKETFLNSYSIEIKMHVWSKPILKILTLIQNLPTRCYVICKEKHQNVKMNDCFIVIYRYMYPQSINVKNVSGFFSYPSKLIKLTMCWIYLIFVKRTHSILGLHSKWFITISGRSSN